MVEELFRQDAYLKNADATVTALEERGVRLDRTIFYPTGGGQPGDSGGWSRSTPPDITPVPTHTQEAGENYLREAAGNKQGTPAPKEQPKFSVGGKTYQKGRYESEASWSLRQNQLQQKYGQQPQAESAVSRGQLPADTLNPAPSAEP